MDINDQALKPTKEQIIYANLLLIGVLVGIVLMAITYFIYLAGILPAHVDMNLLPQVWGKNVTEYLEITHTPHGWNWLNLLMKGDILNYLGFAFLGLLTVLCYFVLVRGYYREKNWIYTVISVLEIVVLSIAASGLLGSGGH
ncbi:conserved hypothetical protein, membrane [Candidatus Magnetomorum sp. HK-1]|nr:conserved hypothetical protein, membrane [Candidatus Magnetomorum sp. HK-1]